MLPVPTRFFVTTGTGRGPTAEAALDAARFAAGVGEVNLLPVTGVLPIGIEHVTPRKIEPGGLRPAVLAHYAAPSGERAVAGLAWARRLDHQGGHVVAAAGAHSARRFRASLAERLASLAESQQIPLGKAKLAVADSSPQETPYHAAFAALVFL